MAIKNLKDEELEVFFTKPEKLKEFCDDFIAENSLVATLSDGQAPSQSPQLKGLGF